MTALCYHPAPQPGDCLAYGVDGWRSYLTHPFEQTVQTKTWSHLYHVEVYVGRGMSISADYRGVNAFPANFDPERLHDILRPVRPFDLARALLWFEQNARGQYYDALGLLRFYRVKVGPQRRGWFCSELATDLYRAGKLQIFNEYPATEVSPGMFLTSESFSRVWSRHA